MQLLFSVTCFYVAFETNLVEFPPATFWQLPQVNIIIANLLPVLQPTAGAAAAASTGRWTGQTAAFFLLQFHTTSEARQQQQLQKKNSHKLLLLSHIKFVRGCFNSYTHKKRDVTNTNYRRGTKKKIPSYQSDESAKSTVVTDPSQPLIPAKMPFRLKLKKSKQGQYNVASKAVFVITVELLDNAVLECTLTADSTGQSKGEKKSWEMSVPQNFNPAIFTHHFKLLVNCQGTCRIAFGLDASFLSYSSCAPE